MTVSLRYNLDVQHYELPADGSPGVGFHEGTGERAPITGVRAGPPSVACRPPVLVRDASHGGRWCRSHGIES